MTRDLDDEPIYCIRNLIGFALSLIITGALGTLFIIQAARPALIVALFQPGLIQN